MSAHLVGRFGRARSVEELRDARQMAHRMILARPDAPGVLLHALYCLELGAEIRRRGELAPECPYCRADVDAAAGKPAATERSYARAASTSAQLVEATP